MEDGDSKTEKETPDEDSGCCHFICNICTKSFGSLELLKLHQNTPCKENPWKCKYCPKAYDSPERLDKHAFVHKELPVTCKACGEVLKTLHEVRSHEQIHNNRLCLGCKKQFTSNFDYQNHKLYCRAESSRRITVSMPFVCLICGKGFKVRCLFIIHLFSHSDETLQECEKCGMKFNFISRLKNKTLKNRNYCCEICDQGFESNVLLKNHMLTHSNKKTYGCSVCQKQYKYFRSYQSHVKMHVDDDKQWFCGLCAEPFCNKEDLMKHLITHDEPNPPDSPKVYQSAAEPESKKIGTNQTHSSPNQAGTANTSLVILLDKNKKIGL